MLNLLVLASEAPEVKWGVFVPDDSTISGLFLALGMGILVYVMIQRARAGLPIPEIRRIAGMEAFEEAVGRATEMGRPVHITNYSADVGDYDTWGVCQVNVGKSHNPLNVKDSSD